jgi:hypothetical protein
MIILQRHPLAQRTEDIAEMEGVRGGLGKGKYTWPASTAM